MAIRRQLARALRIHRLARVPRGRLPLSLRFKIVGLGGSRLVRGIRKMEIRLAKLTLGQSKIKF